MLFDLKALTPPNHPTLSLYGAASGAYMCKSALPLDAVPPSLASPTQPVPGLPVRRVALRPADLSQWERTYSKLR
ncbi:protein of unknown function [Methylocaldum szegediense]|uniref:Uncharacterized protein n=1 Tax=Methylocaldum szegediense TaxID=73780 RepID=A0ABM9HZZ6_9GAMM|nr:protein of unknown function [Methylocaldum szegediense]